MLSLSVRRILFDRWVGSQNITYFEGLRDLMIMEDFKNCLPKHVSAYLGEQPVKAYKSAL